MPEVIVELAQGRTVEQKRAVVETRNVQAKVVTVIIHEYKIG